MTLALIAGQGGLPRAVKAAQPQALVCALRGFPPEVPADLTFRLETLGTLLEILSARGVTRVCLAGAITRVALDPAALDAATVPLVPRVMAALQQGGDDAALRAVAPLFEARGMVVTGAHELAPDLLPPPGMLAGTTAPESEAARGMALLGQLSAADLGQGCVIRGTRVLAVEAAFGTDWMLRSLAGQASGAVFVKAPKLEQDRRFDLPAIGPETVTHAQAAGIGAIVIEAGGVIVLERAATIRAARAAGVSIWVRP